MPERLRLLPISIKRADRFVADHHRHHQPTHGKAKFALGATRGGGLVGVAIAGRPKGAAMDDNTRLEVVRLCTHEHPDARNAVSFLLARVRRVSEAMGYTAPPITYIQAGESGDSLTAAGWCKVADVPAQSWDRPGRRRDDKHTIVDRERWQAA